MYPTSCLPSVLIGVCSALSSIVILGVHVVGRLRAVARRRRVFVPAVVWREVHVRPNLVRRVNADGPADLPDLMLCQRVEADNALADELGVIRRAFVGPETLPVDLAFDLSEVRLK